MMNKKLVSELVREEGKATIEMSMTISDQLTVSDLFEPFKIIFIESINGMKYSYIANVSEVNKINNIQVCETRKYRIRAKLTVTINGLIPIAEEKITQIKKEEKIKRTVWHRY